MLFFTGQENIARLLIHNGADFTLTNEHGKTASDVATEKGIAGSAVHISESIFIFWISFEVLQLLIFF